MRSNPAGTCETLATMATGIESLAARRTNRSPDITVSDDPSTTSERAASTSA